MAPPVAGRKINLTSLLPVTTKALYDTYLTEGNKQIILLFLLSLSLSLQMVTLVSMVNVYIANHQRRRVPMLTLWKDR